MKLFSYASIALSVTLSITNLNALTLKESVLEVLNTNPIVKERLQNYKATQQDLNIAESKYLPTLDFQASTSLQKSGSFNSSVNNSDFHFYETSLKLTQNIFDGYKTTYQVDYEKNRILAAAYNYIEKANDVSFEMVSVYLNVLKNYELLKNAEENIIMNKRLLADIKSLYNAKLVTKTDLKKVQASLIMAETNYIILENNTKDAEYSFSRVLGKKPEIGELSLPSIGVAMPSSIENARMDAVKNNPSLLVSKYNIKGAEALYKRDKHTYYPKVDFQLEQLYDNAHEDNNGFESDDDRTIAKLQFKWNLYNGGADSAQVQKKINKIKQENEIKKDLERQVIEGLELSYSAHNVVSKQIEKLNIHDKFVNEILYSLLEEYKLGKKSRRTILDILNANSDVINGKARMIGARYDKLYAQYRILDAMGLMVTVVIGNEEEYRSRVNLAIEKPSNTLEPIANNLDKKPNHTVKKEKKKEIKKVKVAEKVTTKDNILDKIDLKVNFDNNSSILRSSEKPKIISFSNFLKKHPEYKATIVGHTSNIGSAKYNQWLSQRRAKRIVLMLKSLGIESSRLSFIGKGESNPIATNETENGQNLNRRIIAELELIKPKVKKDLNSKSKKVVLKEKTTPKPVLLDKVDLKVNFDYKSSVFNKSQESKIIAFSKYLKKHTKYKATIGVHTCSIGTYKENKNLSEERANNIVLMLTSLGIDPSRLIAHGYGERQPIATNYVKAGREKNRRVIAELELIQ